MRTPTPTRRSDLQRRAVARSIDPIPVATGEHCHNRVMFKQLLQLGGAGVVQIDAARVGGVNENLAVLAMAAKFGTRVCPHAGGVGLCEMVRHLSFFDYVAVSRSLDGRMIEWVDHLHDHFVDRATVSNGCYDPPIRPGTSARMLPESIERFRHGVAPSPRPAP